MNDNDKNSTTILIVPGLRDHVPEHWQTLLAEQLPKVRSVPPLEQDKLSLPARVDSARVRLTRHGPDSPVPITAQVNLDVNGRLVRAQVAAHTEREAVDLLEARLRHVLRRWSQRWSLTGESAGQPQRPLGRWAPPTDEDAPTVAPPSPAATPAQPSASPGH